MLNVKNTLQIDQISYRYDLSGDLQIGANYLLNKCRFGSHLAASLLLDCCFLAGLLLFGCCLQQGISKQPARKQQQSSNKS
jgi:hypothetical protein